MNANSPGEQMAEQEALSREVNVNPIVHLIAPIAAIGATMIVRKIVNSSYRGFTGREAPRVNDATVPLVKALLWAAATAAIAAGVEVMAYRVTNHLGSTESAN